MQKGIKPFLIASLLAAFLAGTVALAATPPVEKEKKECDPVILALFGEGLCKGDSVGGMKCDPHDYPKKDNSTCSRCQQVVTDWKKKLKDLAEKTAGKDKDLAGGLTKAATELGKATEGDPLAAYKGAGKTKKTGSKTQKDRADNARQAETELKNCQAEVQKACRQLVKEDRTAPEQINKICVEAAKKAGEFAKKKDENGGDMKKAMDGLGDLARALGPLAQALAKKDDEGQPQQQDPPQQYPQDTAQPTPETEEQETAVSELKDKDSKTGESGAINGVQFGTLTKPDVAATGSGLTGLAIGGASSGKPDSDSGSSPLGPNGAVDAPSGSGSAGGGGLGGGSSGGSGASRAGEGAVAAEVAKDLGLELNYAGGVRAGGGGKGGKGADDPPPMLDSGFPPAGDMPPMEAERDPASTEEDLNDAGDSIFMRVKSRYATLKGAGRI